MHIGLNEAILLVVILVLVVGGAAAIVLGVMASSRGPERRGGPEPRP